VSRGRAAGGQTPPRAAQEGGRSSSRHRQQETQPRTPGSTLRRQHTQGRHGGEEVGPSPADASRTTPPKVAQHSTALQLSPAQSAGSHSGGGGGRDLEGVRYELALHEGAPRGDSGGDADAVAQLLAGLHSMNEDLMGLARGGSSTLTLGGEGGVPEGDPQDAVLQALSAVRGTLGPEQASATTSDTLRTLAHTLSSRHLAGEGALTSPSGGVHEHAALSRDNAAAMTALVSTAAENTALRNKLSRLEARVGQLSEAVTAERDSRTASLDRASAVRAAYAHALKAFSQRMAAMGTTNATLDRENRVMREVVSAVQAVLGAKPGSDEQRALVAQAASAAEIALGRGDEDSQALAMPGEGSMQPFLRTIAAGGGVMASPKGGSASGSPLSKNHAGASTARLAEIRRRLLDSAESTIGGAGASFTPFDPRRELGEGASEKQLGETAPKQTNSIRDGAPPRASSGSPPPFAATSPPPPSGFAGSAVNSPSDEDLQGLARLNTAGAVAIIGGRQGVPGGTDVSERAISAARERKAPPPESLRAQVGTSSGDVSALIGGVREELISTTGREGVRGGTADLALPTQRTPQSDDRPISAAEAAAAAAAAAVAAAAAESSAAGGGAVAHPPSHGATPVTDSSTYGVSHKGPKRTAPKLPDTRPLYASMSSPPVEGALGGQRAPHSAYAEPMTMSSPEGARSVLASVREHLGRVGGSGRAASPSPRKYAWEPPVEQGGVVDGSYTSSHAIAAVLEAANSRGHPDHANMERAVSGSAYAQQHAVLSAGAPLNSPAASAALTERLTAFTTQEAVQGAIDQAARAKIASSPTRWALEPAAHGERAGTPPPVRSPPASPSSTDTLRGGGTGLAASKAKTLAAQAMSPEQVRSDREMSSRAMVDRIAAGFDDAAAGYVNQVQGGSNLRKGMEEFMFADLPEKYGSPAAANARPGAGRSPPRPSASTPPVTGSSSGLRYPGAARELSPSGGGLSPGDEEAVRQMEYATRYGPGDRRPGLGSAASPSTLMAPLKSGSHSRQSQNSGAGTPPPPPTDPQPPHEGTPSGRVASHESDDSAARGMFGSPPTSGPIAPHVSSPRQAAAPAFMPPTAQHLPPSPGGGPTADKISSLARALHEAGFAVSADGRIVPIGEVQSASQYSSPAEAAQAASQVLEARNTTQADSLSRALQQQGAFLAAQPDAVVQGGAGGGTLLGIYAGAALAPMPQGGHTAPLAWSRTPSGESYLSDSSQAQKQERKQGGQLADQGAPSQLNGYTRVKHSPEQSRGTEEGVPYFDPHAPPSDPPHDVFAGGRHTKRRDIVVMPSTSPAATTAFATRYRADSPWGSQYAGSASTTVRSPAARAAAVGGVTPSTKAEQRAAADAAARAGASRGAFVHLGESESPVAVRSPMTTRLDAYAAMDLLMGAGGAADGSLHGVSARK